MNFTVTTPLYYVNDKPHLGSTYTTIACDALARFQRLQGNEVNFVTGLDEHGQKIQLTAESNKISPLDHCNKVANLYIDLWKEWDISNNRFIRTTSSRHSLLVNQFFERVKDSGDIVLGNQRGWYCIGCEEYKDEPQQSIKPICPLHLKELEWRDEENLFFKLSNYQSKVESLVSKPDFVQPDSRRNEIINFVSQGLRDFSISRTNVKWGIPVPGYKGHTFYVWFDALLGYLSSLVTTETEIDIASLNELGWPANIHVIGKDILRFHAVYWPAMLMSAGLDIPKKIFGHGFLTREGQKMGKSLGNVLDPHLLLEQYGKDPIRWYLLSDFKFGQDGDFQKQRFMDLVNNDLANVIGNLLNRTSSMSRKWFDNTTPTLYYNDKSNLQNLSSQAISKTIEAYEKLDFKYACESILQLANEANLYLSEEQPWKSIKDPLKRDIVATQIYAVLETCRIIGLLLQPVIPETSESILKQLGYSEVPSIWTKELVWGLLVKGKELPIPKPIINKIDF
ncbi:MULTISPECIES: methionine--tRNA ligase [Prochlorococcus]|uniref:methionine--tRNA ligase n=1 Tax=Prochlorococcus TaxID=1218 RepID=UPI000533B4A8|nr:MULTISPECIES: methionine--tRNA ligase [Prochlorococcus]KGG12426.1 Methionyl-tRNA synthetase [Prochlorococcus sp. MIT 0601]